MKDLRTEMHKDGEMKNENRAGDIDAVMKELSTVLEKEIECYSDLLETARSEQEAIIYGKLNQLKLAIEAEENLVASTRALDNLRQNITALIARELGCEGEGLTLKRIIDHVDDRHRGKLNSLRDKLRRIAKDLEFVNKGNAQLIKSSIEFINETMWVILQSGHKRDGVYDSAGQENGGVRGRVLVDKLG